MARKCVYQSLPVILTPFNCRFPVVRQIKVYRDSETREFIARVYVDGKLWPDADYFDTELDSCIQTTYRMGIANPFWFNPRAVQM
jgi:hypothetical protein